MIHKLSDNDGIELVYTNKDGDNITAVIPNSKLMELLDDEIPQKLIDMSLNDIQDTNQHLIVSSKVAEELNNLFNCES